MKDNSDAAKHDGLDLIKEVAGSVTAASILRKPSKLQEKPSIQDLECFKSDFKDGNAKIETCNCDAKKVSTSCGAII